jgi:hypothetical protein
LRYKNRGNPSNGSVGFVQILSIRSDPLYKALKIEKLRAKRAGGKPNISSWRDSNNGQYFAKRRKTTSVLPIKLSRQI